MDNQSDAHKRGTGPRADRSPRGRALILLDLTRDRVLADGAKPLAQASAISRFVEGELQYFRERGRPVIHSATLFAENDGRLAQAVPYNIRGTAGSELAPQFAPRPGEIFVEKSTDSAFLETSLWQQLQEFGVSQLTIAGVETHTAVLATAIDAIARGYQVSVPDTCVTGANPELHRAALQIIQESPFLRPPV